MLSHHWSTLSPELESISFDFQHDIGRRRRECISRSIHHDFVISLFLWPCDVNQREEKGPNDCLFWPIFLNDACETYVSNMEPQSDLLFSLRHACLLQWSAASRIVAAPMKNVFPRRVGLRSLLRCFNYSLARPSAHSVDLRAHCVLSNRFDDCRWENSTKLNQLSG